MKDGLCVMSMLSLARCYYQGTNRIAHSEKLKIWENCWCPPSIWLELEQVLARPKFNRYITKEERNDFLVDLSETVQFIKVTEQINECRDSKDNKYLELAVSGKAECIVTGDDDLKRAKSLEGN